MKQPFSRRSLILLIGVGGLSLSGGIGLALFADEIGGMQSAGADSFSRSAIGHGAFVDLLEDLDVPVLVSRHDTATKLRGGGVLVIAEPLLFSAYDDKADALRTMIESSERALIILPKWFGAPDPLNVAWIKEIGLLEPAEIDPLMRTLGITGDIHRPEEATLPASDVGPAPELILPQLLGSAEDVEPIIEGPEGILLGVFDFDGREVWVLTDPDLLSNHGLGRGDNASVAVAIIEMLREGERGVIIDETLHGFGKMPSVWNELVEFPLAPATLHVMLVLVVLLWASIGRFGSPQPPPLAIEPGKAFLIHNTASLLRLGGHNQHALRRYFEATLAEVRHSLHAPVRLSQTDALHWLERVGQNRNVTMTVLDLQREVAAAADGGGRAALLAATNINRWKTEILDGPDDNPTNS